MSVLDADKISYQKKKDKEEKVTKGKSL